MIALQNLWKSYPVPSGTKVVAAGLNETFAPGSCVAILGRNGAGKSTLLKMISGIVDSDKGRVIRHGSVSWPVGFAGSFHPDLSGKQNVRFVARIHGVDPEALVDFVGDFSDLGAHFRSPFRTYSSGMRSRLAFGVSMGIGFDTYLVDEITAVGDAGFRRKSTAMFQDRLSVSGAIMVTHSMDLVRHLCDRALILIDGRLEEFENVQSAIARHEALLSL